jgi:hypothetical protein
VNIVSQQLANNKRARFGPRVGTHEWWIHRVKFQTGQKYTKYWTHIPEYQLKQYRALAEVDYKVLGLELLGAPDHPFKLEEGVEVLYPERVYIQPHWLKELKTISWKDFRIWSWLEGARALESPISQEAETWLNYLSLEQTKVEAVEILAPFRSENQKELPVEIDFDLHSVPGETKLINSIRFEVPRGYIYKDLNTTIKDNRPIPITAGGLVFKKKYIKYYLEERLKEYLALGGVKELVEREHLTKVHNLPDPFYWDLWGDIDNLRSYYQYYCADNHLDPLEEEEDLDSVISWDTQ